MKQLCLSILINNKFREFLQLDQIQSIYNWQCTIYNWSIMKVYLATDHAGFEIKNKVAQFLKEQGHEIEDL